MQSTGWRVRKILLGCSAAVLACVVGVALLLAYEPAFYREHALLAVGAKANPMPLDPKLSGELDTTGQGLIEEQAARRLVTKASAMLAAMRKIGPWELAVSDAEINAWLAIDLPRNHSRLLPRGITNPCLKFRPKHVLLGARVGTGAASAVAWLDMEVQLRDINQIGMVLTQAYLGTIPLPRNAILREIARRISAVGMVTDLRRLDGRLVLIVYIPSTHDAGAMSHWLESFSIGDSEAISAGSSRRAAMAPP